MDPDNLALFDLPLAPKYFEKSYIILELHCQSECKFCDVISISNTPPSRSAGHTGVKQVQIRG